MAELSIKVKKQRQSISDFEKKLLSIVDNKGIFAGDNKLCPLKHTFAHGVYVREMKAKKETIIVGKIHQYDHVTFLLSGKLLVATENGTEEFIGPCYFKSVAGLKRVGYVIEDVIWINIHPNPTDTEDLEILEDKLIAKNYLEYEQNKKLK
jgi:hypothetical protein|tara:strand:+ start:853 stop:1305 length:453 start_codon:yes stop_codon:yes gene_type:complete